MYRMVIRGLGTTGVCSKSQSGRFKVSLKQDNPLTYDQAHKPNEIQMLKGWSTLNSSSLPGGVHKSELALSDVFIRKFMLGTWQGLFVSELVVKRQGNLVRVSGIVQRAIHPRKMYFLIGYSEELLAFWLQSVVKLEIQSVNDKKDVVFKFV